MRHACVEPQACFSFLSKLSSSNDELFTTRLRIRRHHHHHHHHYTMFDMTMSTTAFTRVRGIVHACRLPASHHHHHHYYLRQQAYDVTTTTTITTSMTTMGVASHFISITRDLEGTREYVPVSVDSVPVCFFFLFLRTHFMTHEPIFAIGTAAYNGIQPEGLKH